VIVEAVVAQAFATNCWILAPDRNSECFIVDPGITRPSIVSAVSETLRKYNLKPIATLVTHGHLDHTFSVVPFSQEYGVPTYIQSRDRKLLAQPFLALDAGGASSQIMAQFGVTAFSEPTDVRELVGGEKFSLAGFDIEVIHAPGHTAGSAMFTVNDEYLISGDVLFRDGIGRTDMPTGSSSVMAQTLLERVLTLDDSLNVLPGHGAVTTIGRERKQSPYLQFDYLEAMKRERQGRDRG
jgi:glyoxylase-like metal-dependent hydrolase (beta-lactamase superfamily II)